MQLILLITKQSVSIESSGHKINYAPLLSSISPSSLQQGYDFLNGIKGEGSFGFQFPVSSALPGEKNYSPLVHLNFIKWNENFIPRLLVSSEEIEQAYLIGEIQIIRTNIIINSPVMVKYSFLFLFETIYIKIICNRYRFFRFILKLQIYFNVLTVIMFESLNFSKTTERRR